MILIACVDDNLGMMFNKRRQSQDRVLRERVLQLTSGHRLWMNHYSAKMFEGSDAPQINTDDAFLDEAAPGDYCFVEDQGVARYEQWIEKIILFKWNRVYPADQRFDLPLAEQGWRLSQTTEFAGSSHEKITEEVYVK
jgi:hypothetical protein